MSTEPKPQVISIRLSGRVHRMVQADAAAERRSVSNWIEHALELKFVLRRLTALRRRAVLASGRATKAHAATLELRLAEILYFLRDLEWYGRVPDHDSVDKLDENLEHAIDAAGLREQLTQLEVSLE